MGSKFLVSLLCLVCLASACSEGGDTVAIGRTKADGNQVETEALTPTSVEFLEPASTIEIDAPPSTLDADPSTTLADQAPTTNAPTTKAPTTRVPTTKAPTTKAPTTKAPVSQAPTTKTPVTQAPSTQTPTTKTPPTQAPTTKSPGTVTTSTTAPHPSTTAPPVQATLPPNTHANGYVFDQTPTTAPGSQVFSVPSPAKIDRVQVGLGATYNYYGDQLTHADIVSEDRAFNISEVIEVKATGTGTVEIINHTPLDLRMVTIGAKLPGIDEPVRLWDIEQLDAFAATPRYYPFHRNGPVVYPSRSGATQVDVSEYKDKGVNPDEVTFFFMGDTPQMDQLESLSKLDWNVGFGDYDPDGTHPNWQQHINPSQARQWMGAIIDMGYIIASPEFEQQFMASPQGYQDADGVPHAYSAEEKREIYNQMIQKPYIRLGVVAGEPFGLGGGNALGVHFGFMGEIMRYADFEGWSSDGAVYIHEYGHAIGYGHNSSIAGTIWLDDNTPMSTTIQFSDVLNDLHQSGRLPVTQSNYVGFAEDYDYFKPHPPDP